MKKRILSLVLSLVLALTLLPAGLPGAEAATTYPVWVGSTQVTSANQSNIPVSGRGYFSCLGGVSPASPAGGSTDNGNPVQTEKPGKNRPRPPLFADS